MGKIQEKLKSLKSEFVRNVLLVMTGTAVSQAIAIAVTPILTRNYLPEHFGFLLVYLSMLTIVGTSSTGKFERVILLLKSKSDIRKIVFLSTSVSILIFTLLFLLLYIGKRFLLGFLSIDEALYKWLYTLPFLIIVYSSYTVFGVVLNYQKNYKKLSVSKVIKTLTSVFVSLSCIFFLNDARGLILGEIFGFTFATIYIVWPNKTFLFFKNLVVKEVKDIALRYRYFPIFNIPADFMNISSSQMPAFFLTSFFGAGITGFYSLTKRVLDAPVNLFSSSVLEVFRQKAAEQYIAKGNCRSLFLKTAKNLSVVSLIPFIALFVFAPDLFAFVFGEEWYVAGQYARIFSIYYFFKFISSPLSYMFFIAEKQKTDFILQSILFTTTILIFNLPRFFNLDAFYLLWIYSINLVLFYVIMFIYSYRFTIKPNNNL